MIIVFNSTKEWTTLLSWDVAALSFVRGKSLKHEFTTIFEKKFLENFLPHA